MTSNVVIDSCVVAKWILPEADSHAAQQVLSDIALAGGRPIVLDIAFAEVANAIWKRLHRGLITRDEALHFLNDLETLPVLVQPARNHLRLAFAIAADCDRSVYDALCVAAAHELGVRAVTADEPAQECRAKRLSRRGCEFFDVERVSWPVRRLFQRKAIGPGDPIYKNSQPRSAVAPGLVGRLRSIDPP